MIDPKEIEIGDEFIYTINSSHDLEDIYELKLTHDYKNGMYEFFWTKRVFQGTFTANEDIFRSKGYYANTTIVRKNLKKLIDVDDPKFKDLFV